MIERVESLKAGFCSGFTFLIADLVIRFVTEKILTLWEYNNLFLLTQINNHLLWKLIILSGFTGFLFGVTYRYIIRSDQNSHLKDGAVLAFGLTRGLVLLEGLNQLDLLNLMPYLIFIIESLFCFYIARFFLDLGIFYHWLNPFPLESHHGEVSTHKF
jgi:hypothetical protein